MSQFDSTTRNDEPPHAQKPSSRSTLVLGLILIAALGLGARWMLSRSSDDPARAQEAHVNAPLITKQGERIIVPDDSPLRGKLLIEPVAAKDIQRTMVLPAIVEADPGRTVKVAPPLTGRVVNLKVQLGERVTQGEELAVIDSGDLAQAYSDDEKAKTMLTLTKLALDRAFGLEKGGGGAIKDREQAQSDYAQAQSELDRAETRLRSFGLTADQLEKTRFLTLKAPMDGSVTDLEIAQGDFLNDPTATALTISNLDTIWVTANVPEKDTALVTNGQSAEVVFTAYPDEVFKGSVLFVSDVLDPDTRRTKVRIAFDNQGLRLKPNMFANVKFLAPRQSLPSIPTNALVLRTRPTRSSSRSSPGCSRRVRSRSRSRKAIRRW